MSPSYPSRQFDKFASDGLFQVISQRYERGSTVIATNLLC
jgi:DNA replication protein DnaC